MRQAALTRKKSAFFSSLFLFSPLKKHLIFFRRELFSEANDGSSKVLLFFCVFLLALTSAHKPSLLSSPGNQTKQHPIFNNLKLSGSIICLNIIKWSVSAYCLPAVSSFACSSAYFRENASPTFSSESVTRPLA